MRDAADRVPRAERTARPFAQGMFTQVAFGEFHLVTDDGTRLDPFRYRNDP